jgi:glycosyltransferase involved in cell wall biosynthesis
VFVEKSLLILTPEYGPHAWGGLATYLHNVVPPLVGRGATVDVVVSPTYTKGVAAGAPEFPMIPVCGTLDSDLLPAEQMAAFDSFARPRYDAVYVQDQSLAHIAIALRRDDRCDRIVAAAHLPSYSGFSYFDRPLDDAQTQAGEALLFRHSDAVVAPSAFAADILLRVHRLSRSDVYVIPLGAPSPSASCGAPAQVPIPVRASASAPALDVCVVGRIAKQKGLVQLCEVVESTSPRVARFTHIGAELDRGDRELLSRTRMRMLGQRSNRVVLERLRRADVLLSTSLHETFGLAVLEAMACGAVPVAFDCGALSELIEDGVDGHLLPIADSQGMVTRLHELGEQRERLERGRICAIETAASYSWAAHVEALMLQLFPR